MENLRDRIQAASWVDNSAAYLVERTIANSVESSELYLVGGMVWWLVRLSVKRMVVQMDG